MGTEREEVDQLSAQLSKQTITDSDNETLKATKLESAETESPNRYRPELGLNWKDIGGLENIKKALYTSVIQPRLNNYFTDVIAQKSILLYGPPGCSKTMLARALVTESKYDFYQFDVSHSTSPSKLLSILRRGAPGIVIFEEDVLKRPSSPTVTALLENVETKDSIFMIGATSRPDLMDADVAARFKMAIYIPLPSKQDRCEIFKVHLPSLASTPELLGQLAKSTDGYSGAEIARICQEASASAPDDGYLRWFPFEQALDKIRPQTGKDELRIYGEFYARMQRLKWRYIARQKYPPGGGLVVDIPLDKFDKCTPTSERIKTEMEIQRSKARKITSYLKRNGFKMSFQEFARYITNSAPDSRAEFDAIGSFVKDIVEKQNDFDGLSEKAIESLAVECPPKPWDNVKAFENLKKFLHLSVIYPLQCNLETFHQFAKLRKLEKRSILLYGPPGCFKTTLAQALISESDCKFINVAQCEILKNWLKDDPNLAVRRLYRHARDIAPCIMFFSQFDTFAPELDGDRAYKHVLQLQTELDNIEPLDDVYTIALSDRPDLICSELLASFDSAIYVGLPNEQNRRRIFIDWLPGLAEFKEILDELVAMTSGYSCYEVVQVLREAKNLKTKENSEITEYSHLLRALEIIQPETDHDQLRIYEKFHDKLQLLRRAKRKKNNQIVSPNSECDDAEEHESDESCDTNEYVKKQLARKKEIDRNLRMEGLQMPLKELKQLLVKDSYNKNTDIFSFDCLRELTEIIVKKQNVFR